MKSKGSLTGEGKKIASGTLFPEAVLDALTSTRGIRAKIRCGDPSHHRSRPDALTSAMKRSRRSVASVIHRITLAALSTLTSATEHPY
jgi:hypothetical protein